MEIQWYYARDGRQAGPVSEAELHRLARAGKLRSDDLVWRSGMAEWDQAATIGIGMEAQPPPIPTSSSPPPPPRAAPQPVAARATRPQRSAPHRRSFDPQLLIWGGSGLLAVLICLVFFLLSGRQSQVANRSAPRRPTTTATNQTGKPDSHAPAAIGGDQTERQPSASPVARPLAPTSSESQVDRQAPASDAVEDSRSNLELPRTEMPKLDDEPVVATPTKSDEANSATSKTKQASVTATRPTDAPQPAAKLINASVAENSQFAAPRTLFQQIDIQRRPTFSIQGLSTPQNIHYQLFSKLTINPAEDGTRTVTQVVEDTRLLAADDLSRASFAKSLEELKRRQFTYQLNARGDVVDFTGYKKNLAALPVDLLSGNGFMVTSVIDEDGWKELAELTFLVPKLDAQQGEPWQRQMAHDWGQLGSWSGATTFSWGPPNRNNATAQRIDYRHNMAYRAPAAGEGKLPFKITAANFTLRQASGSVMYDRAKQSVSTVEEIFDVSGSVTVDLVGNSVPIELTERQQIKIRLSEQNLAKQQE